MKKSYLLLMFLLAVAGFLFAADPDTFLEVPNSAPILIENIPNQSWPSDAGLIDAFDLDDYFEDAENDLSFSFTPVENISVVIDSDNVVSFLSDSGFEGVRKIFFNASDGNLSTLSNEVYLYVGIDTEAPLWFSPTIDKTKVYQNDFVNFSALWKDSFGLKNFTLYVNQEGVWSEYKGTFSGKENTSSYRVQISSPAGKIVQWKICASDTSYNTNCTLIKQFDVLVTPVNPPSEEGGTTAEGTWNYTGEGATTFYEQIKEMFENASAPDFTTSVNSIVVELKRGETKTKALEITNTGPTVLNFSLLVEGLENYTAVSLHNFSLSSGEKKTISIDFLSSLSSPLGTHYGNLVVQSFKVARLPMALIINDVDIGFVADVLVLNKDKIVRPGRRVVAKIDLKNVKDVVPTEAILEYSLKDFNGNVYDFNTENVSFTSAESFERSFKIPKDFQIGEYIFYVRVTNPRDVAIAADSFTVGYKYEFAFLLKLSSVVLLVFILTFFIFFLLVRYRKQLDKGKILSLYVKLNELRNLINEEKYDEAAALYISLKKIYGEHVSEDLLKDKNKLVEEIKALAGKMDLSAPSSDEKSDEGKEKKEGKEGSSEESSEGEKKASGGEEKSSGDKGEVSEEGEKSSGEEEKSESKEEAPKGEEKVEKVKPGEVKKEPSMEKPVVKKPVEKTFVKKEVSPKKVLIKKPVVKKKVILSEKKELKKMPSSGVSSESVEKKPLVKKIVEKKDSTQKSIPKKVGNLNEKTLVNKEEKHE